jgi:heavy metal efflux system protein
VNYGAEIRRGVVSLNGEEEVVSGIVMQLFGENTSAVIKRLYEKVPEVQASLPKGVHLVPYYEQAKLVEQSTWTVKRALLIGAGLVFLALVIFLGNIRTAWIVALALPVCALFSIICMSYGGVSANLMSLGGIAIAIGMLGDGSIVMVENIFRRINSKKTNSHQDKTGVILSAAREVARPIIFSVTIIIIVFLPIFTLENIEGKMFTPMAFTLTFALLGSILMAVFAAPVICTYVLNKSEHRELFPLEAVKSLYRPVLSWSVNNRKKVAAAALSVSIVSFSFVPFLGTEFIPTLEEGSIFIAVNMAPSISLEEGTNVIQKLEKKVKAFPEVKETVSRIGRPEAGSHPHPVNYGEIHIELKPINEWKNYKNKAQLVKALNDELSTYPGVQLNFTQPIQHAFDELLSGIKAQLAIKVFGEDLDEIRENAEKIHFAISDIPGLVDLSVEQSYGQPQIQVIADREACARYGVNVSEILELVELAVGGEVIDNIYLGTRRFGIHLRYQEKFRDDSEAISNLLVHTQDGALVPLKQVAKINTITGPIQINREHNQRRWIVQGNIRDRDLGSVVADIKETIKNEIDLPPGVYVEYGGQFENQERAMGRLSVIVPVVILLVLFLLGLTYGSWRMALLIFMTIPISLVGGILGLSLTGEYLSVPAAVGFIALFGIGIQNGMVLVSYITQLRNEGKPLDEAVMEGALTRLRPVLMTAVTTVLGLLPLLLASGIGSNVQKPLATVVVFGLSSATFSTLVLIPALYAWFEKKIVDQ